MTFINTNSLENLFADNFVQKQSQRRESNLINSDETKVLVIYTGGTIGMLKNQDGDTLYLCTLSQMDPDLLNVYYPGTVEPPCKGHLVTEPKYPIERPESSTSPIYPLNATTKSFTGEPQRVLYKIIEYFPLLDSSNMSIDHWILIAEDIKVGTPSFSQLTDPCSSCRGTMMTTMGLSSSMGLTPWPTLLQPSPSCLKTLGRPSLSLDLRKKCPMRESNPGRSGRKPNGLTSLPPTPIYYNVETQSLKPHGSLQIPLFELRSDGRQNLLGSLIVAGTYVIPEVLIQFNNNLYRGNRTSKVKADALDAFTTPNFPAIANFGIQIQIDWKNVFPSQTLEKFRVHPTLSKNVGLLRLFPSLTVEVMRIFLSPPLEGIVLQTYGAGNGPTDRKDLLEELKKASDRGVIIVNCTQCIYGPVQSSTYATGSALLEAGVVPGSDMTPEAALTKLSYVLSKSEWSLATKKKTAVSLSDVSFLLNSNVCVAQGGHLSVRDYDMRTPLHIACAMSNAETTRYLLHHGASVHIRDREQRTPLMVAVECDQHDNIRLLVRTGASLNVPKVTVGNMLCQAARNGNILRLESLALAGANPNEMDVTRRTALHA
ncbi:hypothetical protein LAZ67_16000739, partial [Cordylochernes scorpioides]